MKKIYLLALAGLLFCSLFVFSGCEVDDGILDPGITTGSIKVNSVPTDASIWLDGTDTGKITNAELPNINPGSHNITLKKEGYFIFIQDISVSQGDQATINAVMDDIGVTWIKIPEGNFKMGDDTVVGNKGHIPMHNVFLDAYQISKYEVTFNQYDAYCDDTGKTKPDDAGWGRGNRPVINLKWDQASEFCAWLSEKTEKNIHLPTEAQWEKAARGTDRRSYPWGNSTPNSTRANYGNPNGSTKPAGSYPGGKSFYGVHDMAGNVDEWVFDWYSDYTSADQINPQGPDTGKFGYKCFRGGNYSANELGIISYLRNGFLPTWSFKWLGFRIVIED